MKKFLLTLVLSVVLFASGCAIMDDLMIPKEGKQKTDTEQMIESVGEGLVAIGNPLAVPVLAGGSIFSIIAGVYTNMRKKQQMAEKDDKYAQTKIVTESIISVIEQLDKVKIQGKKETLGTIVKEKVKKELGDKDAYVIGKAIISAIKEEGGYNA